MFDFLNIMKDITRAECKLKGLPAPDGKEPTPEAMQAVTDARNILQGAAADSLQAWNRETARVAFSSGNGSCQVLSFKRPS